MSFEDEFGHFDGEPPLSLDEMEAAEEEDADILKELRALRRSNERVAREIAELRKPTPSVEDLPAKELRTKWQRGEIDQDAFDRELNRRYAPNQIHEGLEFSPKAKIPELMEAAKEDVTNFSRAQAKDLFRRGVEGSPSGWTQDRYGAYLLTKTESERANSPTPNGRDVRTKFADLKDEAEYQRIFWADVYGPAAAVTQNLSKNKWTKAYASAVMKAKHANVVDPVTGLPIGVSLFDGGRDS